MFDGCTNLVSVPRLDVGNGTKLTSMFRDCTSLQDLYLYDIKKTIAIGVGTQYGHLLTVDSLIHIINELHPTISTKTLAMGDINIAKLDGLYCKVVDNTNEKLPMVLCESTDEGAMLVGDYITGKGWTYY
jgi:hypothetical protein